MRCLTLLLLSVVLTVSSVSPAADSADIFSLNQQLGRGVNLGNYLEAPRGADWGVTIEAQDFGLIKEAGFDSVRLPVRWPDYASKQPPYTIEPAFFARVDRLLDAAEQVGLNVVLNIHHFDDLNAEPAQHLDRFEGLWKQIAERYQQRPNWLYFELNNEPHDAMDEKWNQVLKRGLAVVRQSNPDRAVIVGPPSWNGIGSLPDLELPDDQRLIVTVHMYNPFEFTHQGASWASAKVREIKDRAWGSPEEVAEVEAELERAAAWGREHQRPIFLGEFGAYGMAPLDSRVKWTATVTRTAERLGMSWAYWEFAAGFGIYDPQEHQWRKPLLTALIPNSPAVD